MSRRITTALPPVAARAACGHAHAACGDAARAAGVQPARTQQQAQEQAQGWRPACARRRWLRGLASALPVLAVGGRQAGWGGLAAALLAPGAAHAGAQQYEVLGDAVRVALSRGIAAPLDAEPLWASARERIDWLSQMSDRLPRRQLPTFEARQAFLRTVRYEAQRAGLEPELVLGLIQVESAFRQHAVSRVGARGYMQVMPFWTRVLGDGNADRLFDRQVNIRYGCVILRHYLDIEKGDLFMALGRYNGSRGRAAYPDAVLAARQRWRFRPPASSAGDVSDAGPATAGAADAAVPGATARPGTVHSGPATTVTVERGGAGTTRR